MYYFRRNTQQSCRGTEEDNMSNPQRHAEKATTQSQTKKPPFDMRAACDLVTSLKPGDKVKIVFADETFDGDLKGRIFMLIGGFRDTIDFGGDGLGMMNLKAVAESGKWEGFRTYTITILHGFDADYFINRTFGRSLFESIEKVS